MICKTAGIPLCRWCEFSNETFCALNSFEFDIYFNARYKINAKNAKKIFISWLKNPQPMYQEKICMRKAIELHLPKHLELFDKLVLMS
jgi:hypothetical protein